MTKPSVDPARWTPPAPARAGHPVAPPGLRVVETSGHGTEDVAVLADGTVVTGVVDGRLLAIDPLTGDETVVARTGGRPLGIEVHPDGGLVVCDAHRGLLHVDEGVVTVLADAFEGVPFRFCNNAAVGRDGTIFFTDSSTKFGIDHWRGDLIEHRPTGRLFRRDPDGTLSLLLDDLAFGNGVALAADESFVVVAETGAYALRRTWLTGDRAGVTEPFGTVLPGFPDNISTGTDGNVWVAVASPRDAALDVLLPRLPLLRRLVWSLPPRLQPQPKRLIRAMAFSPDGALVHDVAGEHPGFGMPTGVRQSGDAVWLGSLESPTIAVFDVPRPGPSDGALGRPR
ncbi:SMP-30/gluconolactonase/LRE family protein [Aeromicrobium fastidiosum]|uniref:SMP-30/gluconolactonase/LRE family protein n=1 Tax=Aeromicrobium TaxID=2040 RepID=UPI001783AA16|nr:MULTISPECIES: SMP-30/gluconolactonase/LRE family protein [Aeromicrobium]MBD8606542.1 SMP-30/gluconolactonase/LRE family protein [Aeromicrobium sp. CFBP 8757]MCL8250788.1 SMP-30/gluconolactonase/LRE family protein [Aeromicrobium fastidiosum]